VGTIGYKVPGLIVKKIFDRRVEKFDSQLVDALNMMSNAVKSGLSFMQVVQVIEREMPVPISEEFAMVLKENRVGVNLTDALTNMTKRIPSEDLFMIMNSVVTLSQAGGNLSEAFETIAKTIRERRRIHDRIKTLSQAAVTQGFLLTIIPLAQLGIQYIIQPQYAALLFTTNLGRAMLFVMFTMIALGGVWMKKILTIEI
jgi:tight adherence protein B